MSDSFTFRANQEQILKRQSKPSTISQNQQIIISSLDYSVQRFDMDKIEKMNRLQLFEILYQVEEINSQLKKQNGFEKTTTFYLGQNIQNFRQKSPSAHESHEKYQKSYNQTDQQFKQLNELINNYNQTKKQRQSDKLYQQTVLNLESQITQSQQNVQNIQPTVSQLEEYLLELETQIKQAEQRLAQQQIMQKYLNLNSNPTQNKSPQTSNQHSSDSDGQIDLIMDELYQKVKKIMVQNTQTTN